MVATGIAAHGAALRAAADPVVLDPAVLRHVFGHYATGVVVLAALAEGRPHGLAANSFTSVSLDPPLVSFCAAASSTTWPRLRSAGAFSVSVLAEHQEEVCRTFARKGADRFAGLSWTTTAGGLPAVQDALAVLDCQIEAVHPAGDHELVLGRVRACEVGPASSRPLLFFRGAYARLATG